MTRPDDRAQLQYLIAQGYYLHACCPPEHHDIAPSCGEKSSGKIPYDLDKRCHLEGWRSAPTFTVEQLTRIWRIKPQPNIGLTLGNGIVRLDIDSERGEEHIREKGLPLPESWEFTSFGKTEKATQEGGHSGGRGILYKTPMTVTCKKKAPYEKVELLGDGEQTVLPPSRHRRGSVYAWREGHAPTEIPLAAAPQWILDAMDRTTAQSKTTSKRELTRNDESHFWNLTIEEVLGEHHGNFPSPFHDSDTKGNSSVSKGVHTCWRHKVCHSPLQALAIKAGIMGTEGNAACFAAGKELEGGKESEVDFSPDNVEKMWSWAKENGILPEDDPHPHGEKVPHVIEQGDFKITVLSASLTKDRTVKAVISLYHKGHRVTAGKINFASHNMRKTFTKGLPEELHKPCEEFLIDAGEKLETDLRKQKKAQRRKTEEDPNKAPDATCQQLFLSDDDYVTWTPEAARLVHTTTYEDTGKTRIASDRLVIITPPRPKRKLVIDEATFFEAEDEGKIVTMSVTQLHQYLKDQGRITLASRAMDVLSLICSRMATETYEGHATYGIYPENGKLVICETPHPMKPEQKKVHRQIRHHIPFEASREDVQAYVEFIKLFHPHEILHKLGLALITPYNPVTKGDGLLIPLEISVGPPDVGKNKGSEAVSLKLYAIKSISGGAINSEFRLLAILDAVYLPRTVNEANKVKPELWPVFKDTAESLEAGQRGTKDQEMIDYNSRLEPMFTCNDLPLVGLEEVLKRFWATIFEKADQVKRALKEKKAAFDSTFRALNPIGYQLQRWWVEAHPDEEGLLGRISDYEKKISDEYEKQGHVWMSPQRAQGWAASYVGLDIFKLGCDKTGVAWSMPSIEWFVRNVVARIEESTWSRTRSNASLFASWLTYWLGKNTRIVKGRERTIDGRGHVTIDVDREIVITGEDVFWTKGTVKVGATEIGGKWVALPLVDTYNRENREGHKFGLVDLGKEAAEMAGISYEVVLTWNVERKTWVTKTARMGDGCPKAVFVPDSLDEGWQIQTTHPQSPEDDSGEWADLVPNNVTSSDLLLPSKVTGSDDSLDSASSLQCDLVTHNTRAHKKTKTSQPPKRVDAKEESSDANILRHRKSQKFGSQGHKGTFSTIWPSVTSVGHTRSQGVTKQPEKPLDAPSSEVTKQPEHPRSPPTLPENNSVAPVTSVPIPAEHSAPPTPLPRYINGRLTDLEGDFIEKDLQALQGRAKGHGYSAEDLSGAFNRVMAIIDEGQKPTVNELRRDLPSLRSMLDLFGSEIVFLGKKMHAYREHRKNNGGAA